jgi:hypothetical protein
MNVIPLEMNDGYPMYFAHGHVDAEEFMATVVSGFEEDRDGLIGAMHGYFIEQPPCDAWPDGWFKFAKADEPGAFPITYTRPRTWIRRSSWSISSSAGGSGHKKAK